MLLGVGLLILHGPAGQAQEPNIHTGETNGPIARSTEGIAVVTYQMVRPGLAVPRFRLSVREDGTGTYAGEEIVSGSASNAGPGSGGSATPATSHVEREIAISPATTAKIFKVARAEKQFQIVCASKAKNIADTGAKTLSYSGPDGKGSCDYNYSENKGVVMLTDLFLGMAATIDEGRKLEFKHRYDRLGLDAELDTLTQANDAGRAVELGTVAPVLRALAGDTELMQRVRLRASKLLDRANEGK